MGLLLVLKNLYVLELLKLSIQLLVTKAVASYFSHQRRQMAPYAVNARNRSLNNYIY